MKNQKKMNNSQEQKEKTLFHDGNNVWENCPKFNNLRQQRIQMEKEYEENEKKKTKQIQIDISKNHFEQE